MTNLKKNNQPQLLIFDVNETLINMAELEEKVNHLLDHPSAFRIWFPSLLHHSLVETLTNSYHDFSDLARATLAMTAEKMGVDANPEEIKTTLTQITRLPAHDDVASGLTRLRHHGYQLAALTNGTPAVAREQLQHAGLTRYFDDIYSIEAVKKYKPHAAPYLFVIEEKGLEAENAMMVAAHGWDIAGAQRAGLQTAFIQRPGQSLFPLALPPTGTYRDISDLADRLCGA